MFGAKHLVNQFNNALFEPPGVDITLYGFYRHIYCTHYIAVKV